VVPVHPTIGALMRTNLPAELAATFVDGGEELATAREMLSRARLVTLTGAGGIGKSRVALELIRRLGPEFSGGAYLVDLLELRDGALLAPAIAGALNLADQSAASSLESLAYSLRGKRMLLTLDNCEHLAVPCAELVAELLETAPQLHVVATSRRTLGVRGEHVLEIMPLPIPASNAVDAVRHSGAGRLFEARATAADPGFRINAGNAVTVAKLCRRLEGVPLALELAAVRLRHMSLERIAADLLGQDEATDPSCARREQMLRPVLEWSHQLCTLEEQILWRRLAVFPGSFDLAAAEVICTGDGIAPTDVYFLIAELVDQSIVQCEPGRGPTRYRLLNSTRQFGYTRLENAQELTRLRMRHHDYFYKLVVRLKPEYSGPQQRAWLQRMRENLPNLRAVLAYALETRQTSSALTIAPSIAENLVFHGRLPEARLWLERMLDQIPELTTDRAKALVLAAWIAVMQGDTRAATAFLEACQAQDADVADRGALARISGVLAFFQGDLRRSMRLLEEAVRRCRLGAEDPNNAFLAVLFRAAAASFLHDHRARAFTDECLQMAESKGAEWWFAWALWAAGVQRWSQGHLSEASGFLRDALERLHELGDRWGPVWCLATLAWTTSGDGRNDDAAYLHGATAAFFQAARVPLDGVQPIAEIHRRHASELRAVLGDGRFDAAYARGEQANFADVIGILRRRTESCSCASGEVVPTGTAEC
jgi:predicted ATPase